MNKSSAWGWLILGIIMMIGNFLQWLEGDTFWRGAFIPAWTNLPLSVFGFIFCLIALYGLRHPAPPPNTNAEAAKAKAKMDQMYFNEYGVWPDYKEVTEILPENEAKSDQASAGSEAGNANLKATTPIDTKSPVD